MEEDTLMCAPVQEGQPTYPGSIESECADCGTKVWVSPSGQKLVREEAVTIICTKCTLARIEKAPEPPEMMITKEAAGEVRAWQKRN